MKNASNSAICCNQHSFATGKIHFGIVHILVPGIITLLILATGCKKEMTTKPEEIQKENNSRSITERNSVGIYTGLPWQTHNELQQARAATARYQNINNAIKDGYEDINVVAPNMGYHFMKESLVDNKFDIRNPEILVYNKNMDGDFYLVAVEYAVPLSFPMPEGFYGNHDVWDGSSGFPLWLLHAWVWTYNPDGVFNPTNRLVHLH